MRVNGPIEVSVTLRHLFSAQDCHNVWFVHNACSMYQPVPGPEGRPDRIQCRDDNLISSAFLRPVSDPARLRSSVAPDPVQPFALLFVDLDQLRLADETELQNLNDYTLIRYRDRLLALITDSLRSQLREEDLISRVSATEFVIALRSDLLGNVPQVASRLADLFNQPILLEGQRFQISCSIGVSFYPGDGQNTHELIEKANLAMHQAKAHGAWDVRLYPSKTSRAIHRRLQIERALVHPDLRHQLEMVYQPQWDCIGDRLYGFEALVRWHHPTLGEISPVEFIPIAEELGCIHRITQVAISESLQFARDIVAQYDVILKPSVNVSAQEFREFRRLYKMIDQQLHRYQFPGNLLTIELTERVFLQPSDQIVANMTRLRDRGICLALDDFGTGFSGLNYLLDLPLNVLKIDRSFVQSLDQDPRRRGVVQAIVSMAKSLDMRCVAEGVETQAELQCLQDFGCALTQGHQVAPALTQQAFLNFLKTSNVRPSLNS